MIAELKVYGDCSSQEPTKVYTLYRLTPYVKGQIQDFLFNRFDNKEMTTAIVDGDEFQQLAKAKYGKFNEEEMMQELMRLLQTMFPKITYEEVTMLDYGDWTGNNGQMMEFFNTIAQYGDAEDNRALKN